MLLTFAKIKPATTRSRAITVFSPLAQGLLTDRYLHGIPADSRAARSTGFLQLPQVTDDRIAKARRLNEIASRRGQTLAQMVLGWILTDERVTSVIIGASSVKQPSDNLGAIDNLSFSSEDLVAIRTVLTD